MGTRDLIGALLDLGDIKVWSLLVSLFGDRAPDLGDSIAGPDISSVVEPIGIKPEALRVALHRLRKDGWIDSTKSGRMSLYHMTEKARQEAHAVRTLIYAPHLALPKALWLVHDTDADGVLLGREALLTDRMPAQEVLSGQVDLGQLPLWLGDAVIDPQAQQRFADLSTVLDDAPFPADDDPLRDTARLMVLHAWRRLVLRHDPLALALQGPTAPAAICRRVVSTWLEDVPVRPD